MKHNEEFKSFERDEDTRRLIQNRITKIERTIQAFPPDSVFLRVFVEAIPARTLYHATLTLDVPGKKIAAKYEAHDAKASLNAAFDELEVQVRKHKDSLTHERLWKRIFKRDELRRMKAAAGKDDSRKREAFFQLVNPHLDWLDHFTRDLVRYSEAMGELGSDELTPEEVVDAALIKAYRQFLKNLSIGEVRSWLTRAAVDQLDSEINRLLSERQRAPIHIQDDVPETPPKEQVVQLGDESLYFYQPDEDLKFEDVIPDPDTVTPEEALAATETRQCVAGALRSVPDEWRRILLLYYAEGQALAKIADSVGKPESEVRRILLYSTRYVRQRLIESGCAPTNRRRAA